MANIKKISKEKHGESGVSSVIISEWPHFYTPSGRRAGGREEGGRDAFAACARNEPFYAAGRAAHSTRPCMLRGCAARRLTHTCRWQRGTRTRILRLWLPDTGWRTRYGLRAPAQAVALTQQRAVLALQRRTAAVRLRVRSLRAGCAGRD